MSTTWTNEQQKVIDTRNRNLLVSAAAGSGKTAVLVERIIKRITEEENPTDIDRLLVVTFTKAAAAEMRERVAAAIDQKRDENPKDSNLLRQSSLIHNAMITTIDSFCLFVVRNHFEEINLDPNFRIADEGEMKLMEKDVLDEVLEEWYRQKDEAFLSFVDRRSNRRGDEPIRDMVTKIYHMSASSPWPKKWIWSLMENYQVKDADSLYDTPLMQSIVRKTTQIVVEAKGRIEELLSIANSPAGPEKYAKALESDLVMLEEAEEYRNYYDWFEFFSRLKFDRLAAVRGEQIDVLKKEAVQNGRAAVKEALETLKSQYFSVDTQELLRQNESIAADAEILCRLAISFIDAMDKTKRKKRVMDFGDIEHFALQILVDEKTGKPKQTAQEFREHFDEIMIDEYQDSNQVQEEILNAIARDTEDCHNLFMVGDVKQSIYRFRMARPELFMHKFATYETDGETNMRIDLHKNFRSRKEVLDFSNDIFYKIMSKSLGAVEYDKAAALYAGASYPKGENVAAEVLFLDEKEEGFPEEDKRSLEARMIAARILELKEHGQVWDQRQGIYRKVKNSDIVILLRTLKGWGTEFTAVLEACGIPAHVESQTGYFASIEVQTMLNMLCILDNPLQDIPMAAVLKSPLVGLDNEELAEIHAEHMELSFAEAALCAMRNAKEGKLKTFFERYTTYRQMKDVPIHELIGFILRDTGYGNYVAALPAGEQRAANLQMLREKAIAYEKTSYKGLFHFVRYIDTLRKYDIDFGEADVTSENADVVHIMTIHKSKGLEFPIVFVAGLSKQFNNMEANEGLVLHADFGMGLDEIELSPKRKRSSLIRTEIANAIREDNLGEELRILYVAMTRAKEKLLLTGVLSDAQKTIAKYKGNVKEQQPLHYYERAGAKCYMDWVIPALLSYPDKYHITFVTPEELVHKELGRTVENALSYELLMEKIHGVTEEAVGEITKQFAYVYPFAKDATKKSKYSVSELKHASMVGKFDREEGQMEIPQFLLEEKESYIPSFAGAALEKEEAGKLSDGINPGALRGTAVHRVMECLDFAKVVQLRQGDEEAVKAFVKAELERMVFAGELTEDMRRLIVPRQIESFVKSKVAMRMAHAAKEGRLFKEKPFVMEHNKVLVQGIIDVFWFEGEELVLLDYKTDRVKTADELIMRYKTQLDLYADALGRIFSNQERTVKVKESLLYSFRLQEEVKI